MISTLMEQQKQEKLFPINTRYLERFRQARRPGGQDAGSLTVEGVVVQAMRHLSPRDADIIIFKLMGAPTADIALYVKLSVEEVGNILSSAPSILMDHK
jgi:hypothetical protein